MRVYLISLICILLFSPVVPLVSQEYSYDLPIQEHIFTNGLRLLVLERPEDHRVTCKIFTDFGALVEIPGELGSAHFLEHLMFKGTHTLGTKDWEAESPIIEQIYATEQALVEELNRSRNDLRERGVFHDYRHAVSTPRIDSLRQEIARLEKGASKYRDNGAMMKWYQGFGGTKLTATTEQEYMKFDINLPRERVELFLRVEADRMRNSVFREFDQERMILVEQRYGDLNRPTTPYYEAMNALVHSVHPVFWPEGYLTDFYQYSRHYERELYESYFVPNNTTLIFIGWVTMEQMVPLVERYFGWMERSAEPMRAKAIEPVPQAEKRLIWRSTSLQPRVEMRFMIPGVGHPDRPHFDVLAEIIKYELNEALKKNDINTRANVNNRVVHASRFGVPASINIEVVTDNESKLAQIEAVMLATFKHLWDAQISLDRLKLAKKKLRMQWYKTALNPDRLAFEIGHFQVMDSWRTLQPYLETREKSTLADLQRLAQRYFIPENRSVGIVLKPTDKTQDKEGTR